MTKQRCPYCNSSKTQRRGTFPKQRYLCTDDKHPEGLSRYFYGESSVASVLLFDIETLPIQMYAWRLGEQNWSPDNIIKDWCVLSYVAKWLFVPSHIGDVLTPKEAVARNDKRIINELWSLMEKADVVIAHNGRAFDTAKINTRFLIHDMPPPSPYQLIDTKTTTQKALGATSNSLNHIAKMLGIGEKTHTDFELWKRCDIGEKAALDEMLSYNVHDTYLLEDVYVKLRPWINHPNMSLYVTAEEDQNVCPRCTSEDIDWGETYTTSAGVFDAFRCNNCGALGRHSKRKRTSKSRVL